MRQFKKRLRPGRATLPCACYLLAALCWLGLCLYNLLYDADVEPASSVAIEDFQLVDLVPTGEKSDVYITTSGDPQMILEGLTGRKLRTLSYVPEFVNGIPREICLYYVTSTGEPFSRDKRVFPRVEADGRYVFTLPRTNIAALRLDPCSPDTGHDIQMAFASNSIDLNAAATLPSGWTCFLPGWYQLFCLLLYPALAAAALDWLRAVYAAYKRENKKPA